MMKDMAMASLWIHLMTSTTQWTTFPTVRHCGKEHGQFPELVLSRRLLFFGDQLTWQCCEHVKSEHPKDCLHWPDSIHVSLRNFKRIRQPDLYEDFPGE